MDPEAGVRMGLKRAQARVKTAFNGSVQVAWKIEEGKLHVDIKAPRQTFGAFVYKGFKKDLCDQERYEVVVDV